MRTLLMLSLLLAVAASASAAAAGSPEEYRFPAYGRLQDVAPSNRKAVAGDLTPWYDVAAIEVIGPKDMRAHLEPKDRGWIPVHLETVPCTCGCKTRTTTLWQADKRPLRDVPELLALIRTAERVDAFPLGDPAHPRRDDRRLRRLSADEQARLGRLLGGRDDWVGSTDRPAWHDISSQPDLGLVFRKGSDELVLFFQDHGYIEATFDGVHREGQLDVVADHSMKGWKHRFAEAEMAAR